MLNKIFIVLLMLAITNLSVLGQARIRFAKGRTSATVSGNLSAGGSRMYVLGARAGQTLVATIRSTNGKVTITNALGRGERTYEIVTEDGDNSIGIYNAGGATKFTLTVSIR